MVEVSISHRILLNDAKFEKSATVYFDIKTPPLQDIYQEWGFFHNQPSVIAFSWA